MTRLKGDCDPYSLFFLLFLLFFSLENMTRLKGDCDSFRTPGVQKEKPLRVGEHDPIKRGLRLEFKRVGDTIYPLLVGEHDPIKRGLRHQFFYCNCLFHPICWRT